MGKLDSSAAIKILKVLSDERLGPGHFKCLSDLAKSSGYGTAASRDFKRGLKILVDKDILKITRRGWSSEKRGTKKHHPIGIILICDVYAFQDDIRDLEEEEDKAAVDGRVFGNLASFELVEVLSCCGNPVYVSRQTFIHEKNEKKGLNFWHPILEPLG